MPTVNGAVTVFPFKLTLSVTFCGCEAKPALTENLPDVCPAATVDVDGVRRMELLEATVTAAPAAGAAPERVTVQEVDWPGCRL